MWITDAMRRADTIDLATIDLASIDLPAKGETMLRDALAPGLALRLRASGARTWVLFGREAGRTTRRTLGDPAAIPLAAARRLASADTPATTPSPSAPLHGPDARVAGLPRGRCRHALEGAHRALYAVCG